MTADERVLDNVRVWLAGAPMETITELLSAARDELIVRLKRDAANYVTRAVSSLDADRFGR